MFPRASGFECGRADPADGSLATFFGHVGDDNAGAFARENHRSRSADSGRRTCYQCAFAGK
jgi:hypothetical protein